MSGEAREGDTPPQGFPAVGAGDPGRSKTPWERWVLLALAVLALGVGAFFLTSALTSGDRSDGEVTETFDSAPADPVEPKPIDTAQDEVENRRAIVALLESDIEKDAKRRVKRGELDGPIVTVSCDPSGGTDIEDLTVDSGDYDCLAVQTERDDGTQEGYSFTATVNFAEESYTWKLED